jgi:hypothetical protein
MLSRVPGERSEIRDLGAASDDASHAGLGHGSRLHLKLRVAATAGRAPGRAHESGAARYFAFAMIRPNIS